MAIVNPLNKVRRKASMCMTLGMFLVPCVSFTASADTPDTESKVGAGDALQEITVTAEKQTRNLQKTAAAVTVVSGDSLTNAGVSDLPDAQKFVPSARFQIEGNSTQVVVRGIGSTLDEGNVEPLVAFNLAGIYVPREETGAAFFDLEQFEVLPGPQGTLYGRSAAGGTINLTPTKPGFNFDGTTMLEVGNYASVHGTVTQNIKASDSAAFRVAVDYTRNDGIMTTGADSLDDVSVRLSSLVNPTDNMSVYVWLQGAGKFGYHSNVVNKGTNPNTGTYCEGCFLYGNPWNDTRSGAYREPFGSPMRQKNDFTSDVIGAQVDYHFEGATLTYLPSYLYLDTKPRYWLGAIQATNQSHYNQLTQELRLASIGGGPIDWLGGIYYFNVRNNSALALFTNLPTAFTQDDVAYNRLEGYSAFGQTTYHFTETLRGTLGARVSSTGRSAGGDEPAALGGAPYTFDRTYNHVDWKAGLDYDLLPKSMLYGAVQTGYQTGTFNELPNIATFSNEVKPSKLLSYTGGIKSRWLDDRLQINDELYYYDYRDLLIQSYSVGAAYNTIFNASKVAIKGDQLNILARVFSADQANLDIGYSHARNVKFITPGGQNFNGYQLANSPDLTAIAGYTHNVPMGDATLHVHLDWRFESSWYGDYVHNPGTKQNAYTKGDGNITYDATAWTIGLWIKNIQNRATVAALGAAGIPGPATAYLDEPRSFGVRFTARY